MTPPPGWIHDPGAIADTTTHLSEQGLPPTFRSVGYTGDPRAGRLIASFFADEIAATGKHLPPVQQTIGSCVGYGTAAAINRINARRIAAGSGESYCPASPAYIYGVARVNIGGGRLRGDGAVVAYAARGVSQAVLFARDYGSLDLSSDPHDVTCKRLGQSGIPANLMEAGRYHKVGGTTHIDSPESYTNALWLGHAITGGCDWLDTPTRDEHGQCKPHERGAHCQARLGVYIDQDGDTAIIKVQSWGAVPNGPNAIVLQDGTRVPLPVGHYGIKAHYEFNHLDASGDFWALMSGRGWCPDTVTLGGAV